MSQLKNLKRIASFVLVFGLVLFLVSCSKKTDVPYGDISDNVYLTVGNDITITEKELYDSYRKQGAPTLATMLDNVLFEEELALVDKLLSDDVLTTDDELIFTREELREKLNDLVLNTMFKNNDLESIAKSNSLMIQVAVEKYVDSLFTLDNEIDRAALFSALLDHINDALENNDLLALYTFDEIKASNRLNLAQTLYAKKVLLENVNDEESDEFVDDKAVINYYKSNVRNRHDVDVFYFTFRHAAEASAALRQVGIKADASGNWFKIPYLNEDGKWLFGDSDITNAIANEDPDYIHIFETLNTLNIPIEVDRVYTQREYAQFYSSYTPNSNRTNGLADTKFETDAEVLELFVEAYNLVNTNQQLEIVDSKLQYVDSGTPYETLKTYEDLATLGATIRTYIYDSLSVDPEVEGAKAYSSLRSSGNLRYLIFKFADHAEADLIAEEKDADGNDLWIEDLTEEQEALIEEWRNEVIKSRLTSGYVSTTVNKFLDEAKLDIYDNVLRSFYEDNYPYDGTEKNKSGNVLATINGKDITVRDFYNRMDQAFGVSMALDLAVNKYLLSIKDTVVTDKDMKEYEKSFKDLINSFSANEFAQAGYPASVGRAKFLLAVFGAENNQEAIELGFVIPELRNHYLTDYENHYDDVYEKLAILTNKHVDLYKGVTTSHLLVYFDQNGDGNPDNPAEYLDSLDPAKKQEVLEGILELVNGANGIYEQLASDVNIADIPGGLDLLAKEVNNAGRITLGNNTRDTWTEYAKLGLNVKFEAIPSQITNTSNFQGFIGESGTLDEVYYNRALALHDMLIGEYDEAQTKLSHLDFYPYNERNDLNELLTVDVLENILMSDFGFHFILVTGLDYVASFEYDGDNDTNENYTFDFEDKTYNIYNDDAKIKASQIEYKILGESDPELGAAMPTSVSRAFTKHFTPIFDIYTKNANMQRELFFGIVNELGVSFTDAANNAVFEEIKTVNRRQFFNYINQKGDLEFDANYEALYGDWFTVLEG